MFAINPSDPTPIYAQLERAIRVAIATGRLQPGERLPTVRQLAVELRINANTVAKVYGELERVGVLETRRGVGTFAAATGPEVDTALERGRRLATIGGRFVAEAASLGLTIDELIEFLQSMRDKGGSSHADRD